MVFSNPAEISTKSLLNTHLEHYYYPKLPSKCRVKVWQQFSLKNLLFDFILCRYRHSGFGGLGVACWPLIPKFVGSNPAKVVTFLRAKKKNPQHAFLRRGSKAVGPTSQICSM
jgi:hypothetical protein